MKRKVVLGLILLVILSCKKNIVKTHPTIAGTWHWLNWCDSNNYTKKDLNIDSKSGKGAYYIHNSLTGKESNYNGRFKTENDDVYINGEFVFTIVDIIDTIGIYSNPNPPSFCSEDNFQVSGILKIINKNGEPETYWKYE